MADPNSLTGAYLSGAARDPDARRRGAPGNGDFDQDHAAHASTTSRTSTSTSRWASSSASPAYPAPASRTLITRDPVQEGGAGALHAPATAPAQHDSLAGPRAPRQGDRRRPVADRPHAALEPGDLHRHVHRPSASCSRPCRKRGCAATSRAASASTSRAGAARPARARATSRSRCSSCRTYGALRGLQRQALQPRGAGDPLQGQEHRRSAGDDGRRGARVLRRLPQGHDASSDAAGRRPRLHHARPAGDHGLRRRGAAHQALDGAITPLDGPHALHPRRADDGPRFEDVRNLLTVLQRLADAGNTVVVIEHHLDVMLNADHIIDLGPLGGYRGGRSSPRARRRRSHATRPAPRPVSSAKRWSAAASSSKTARRATARRSARQGDVEEGAGV